MIKLNIHEAKAHLSRYLERLLKGEVIELYRRNVLIAQIRAVMPQRTKKRPIGLARGDYSVPKGFFKPLPEDVLKRFEDR